jgi:hypothetical protein
VYRKLLATFSISKLDPPEVEWLSLSMHVGIVHGHKKVYRNIFDSMHMDQELF